MPGPRWSVGYAEALDRSVPSRRSRQGRWSASGARRRRAPGDPAGGVELRPVPLPVVEAERVALAASPAGRWPGQVAESMPPDSSTTARDALSPRERPIAVPATSVPGSVAPQVLVQLDLEAHRQAVREYPVGQLPGRLLASQAGENRTSHAPASACSRSMLAGPLVVRTVADDELDLVFPLQVRQVVPAGCARISPMAGVFRSRTTATRRSTPSDIECAAGLQRHLVARRRTGPPADRGRPVCARGSPPVTQTWRHAEAGHARQDLLDAHPLAAMEGIGRVAVAAAQRAARQAHERRGPAGGAGLALDGVKDLGDAQCRQGLVLDGHPAGATGPRWSSARAAGRPSRAAVVSG